MDIDEQLNELKIITGTKKRADLSKALGVSPSTIGSWKDRGKIPEKILLKVNLKYKNEATHTKLPFYEVSASAGPGELIECEQESSAISFAPEWLRNDLHVNPNEVFLMLAKGDSMQPTIKDGAMIMVEKFTGSLADGVYVMRHENNLLVKRLHVLPTGVIKVQSDNVIYEPYELTKEQLDQSNLEILGRVVWSGQRM